MIPGKGVLRMLTVMLGCLLSLSCNSERFLEPIQRDNTGLIRTIVSSFKAVQPDSIAITIEIETETQTKVGLLAGVLSYDTSKLRYLGQEPNPAVAFPLTVVNASRASEGQLDMLVVDPAGVSRRPIVLAFAVLATGYSDRLMFVPSEVISTTFESVPTPAAPGRPVQDTLMHLLSMPVVLGSSEWDQVAVAHASRLIDSVPANRKFGDVDGNGSINGLDVLRIANWQIGQPSPAGTIIPVPGDLQELVGNVGPFNSPGLGEASDTKGPGWDASCVRGWDGLDVLAVANENAGNNPPVVGELIPSDAVDPLTRTPRIGSACSGVRPPVPSSMTWPNAPLVVAAPTDTAYKYIRNIFAVQFDDTVSGVSITSFLTQFGGTIVGGTLSGHSLEAYYIQTPDPGATFAKVDSVAKAMMASPGVYNVRKVTFLDPMRERGRYPEDQLISSRSLWMNRVVTSTPWWMVRAPQAWSCEKGAYGGALTKVAVFDKYFDVVNPDLPPATVFYPDTGKMKPDPVGGGLTHGNKVAGVLTAIGDNQAGVAGMIWNSNLVIYPRGKNGSIVADDAGYLIERLVHAESLGVKVFNLSGGSGIPGDSGAIRTIKDAMRTFVGSPANRLIVIATGQDEAMQQPGLSLSLAQMRATNDPRLSASDHAAAELQISEPAAGAGIVFVTGVDTNGSKNTYANSWTNSDRGLAAPMENVGIGTVPGSLYPLWGTSFAAPMVSGVAALLWTMDPSLSGSDVKTLMHTGASAARLNAAGVSISPGPVSGTAYLLDAYGSLALLSRSRPGTPLCGIDVLTGTTSLQTDRLVFGRTVKDSLLLPMTNTMYWGTFSIAQGGRRLVMDAMDSPSGVNSARYFNLSGGSWSAAGVTNGPVRTVFTEKDTVYIRDSTVVTGTGQGQYREGHALVRIESSDPTHTLSEIDVTTGLPGGAQFVGYSLGSGPVSPDGGWLFLGWAYRGSQFYCTGPGSQDGMKYSYVIPLRSQQGGNTGINSRQNKVWCGEIPPQSGNPTYTTDEAVWRPDADQFLVVKQIGSGADSNSTNYQMWDLVPSAIGTVGSSTTIAGFIATSVAFGASGTHIRSIEQAYLAGGVPCYLRTRGIASLTTISNVVTLPSECGANFRFAPSARPGGEWIGRAPQSR